MGEPTQVGSKVKLSTKVENTGHWLVEDHARIWEVLKTEEVRQHEVMQLVHLWFSSWSAPLASLAQP